MLTKRITIRDWYMTWNIFFYLFSFIVISPINFSPAWRIIINVFFFLPALIPAIGGMYLECLKTNDSEGYDKRANIFSNIDLVLKIGILALILVFYETVVKIRSISFILLALLNVVDFVITCVFLRYSNISNTSLYDVYLEMKSVSDNEALAQKSWLQSLVFVVYLAEVEYSSSVSIKVILTIAILIALFVCDKYEEKKFNYRKKKIKTILTVWILRTGAITLALLDWHMIVPILIQSCEHSIVLRDQRNND